MPELNAAIKPLAPLLGDAAVIRALDEIFFQASSRRKFADQGERDAFRERWLGRYFGADAANGFVALTSDRPQGQRRIAGYVVGALDNPAGNARFSDIGYYREFYCQCLLFPAHLHINLHADFRNKGLGARLIEAFCVHAADKMSAAAMGDAVATGAAAPEKDAQASLGVHVVTNARARNVGFYNRRGFLERARIACGSDDLVFLARSL